MDKDVEQTLYAYIVLPYVIKVFKLDYRKLESEPLTAINVYLDKLESVIIAAQDDLNVVKRQLYQKHHMKVRYLGITDTGSIRYDWQTPNDSGDILFSPDQLRDLTKDMMALYLYGMLNRPVTRKERAWVIDEKTKSQ